MAANPNLDFPMFQFDLIDAKKIAAGSSTQGSSTQGILQSPIKTPKQATDAIGQIAGTADIAGDAAAIGDEYSSYIDKMGALEVPETLDLSGYTDQLSGLQTQLDEVGSQYDEPINALLAELEAGQGQYVDEAANYTAQTMGYANAEEMQADLASKLGLNYENAQGLTQEERDLYQKQANANIASMERQSKDQLESIYANTGSTTRYLSAADEARGQISDTRLSYDVAIAQEDFTRKLNEINRNDEQMKFLISSGQATAANYLQQRQQGVVNALGGYMQKISTDAQTIMSQAQLIQGQASLATSEYNADLQALVTSADLIYKTATLEMGVDQFALDQAEQQYNSEIAPLLDSLNAMFLETQIGELGKQSDIAEQQIGATQEAADAGLAAAIFGGLAGVLAAIIPVVL